MKHVVDKSQRPIGLLLNVARHIVCAMIETGVAFPDFSRAANGHGSEIKSIDSVHLSKLEVAIVTANLSYLEACFTYPALYTV
jgi:hypothetical protein